MFTIMLRLSQLIIIPNIAQINPKYRASQQEGHPLSRPYGVPCAARQAGRLRNSGYALRQSSPKAPIMAVLLGAAAGGGMSRLASFRERWK